MPRTPPDDPAEWDDDQWLEWLAEVDAEAPPEPEGPPSRRGRSLTVTMLGSAMLGLHRAIYGDLETDIVMVIEADGEPPDPERLEVHLDPEDPEASTVTVRPWLEDGPPVGAPPDQPYDWGRDEPYDWQHDARRRVEDDRPD